jgi:hypothetical protein
MLNHPGLMVVEPLDLPTGRSRTVVRATTANLSQRFAQRPGRIDVFALEPPESPGLMRVLPVTRVQQHQRKRGYAEDHVLHRAPLANKRIQTALAAAQLLHHQMPDPEQQTSRNDQTQYLQATHDCCPFDHMLRGPGMPNPTARRSSPPRLSRSPLSRRPADFFRL